MEEITESRFHWITSEHPELTAFIAVDKQLRLYFNRTSQKLVGGVGAQVQVGYDFANRRLVVAPADIVRPANVRPHRLDKRGYTSARPFIRALGLTIGELPIKYTYLGKDYTDYPAGAFVFGLNGEAGEDGAL